ncbi:MAG: 5'-nucleotidase C-terminal domain-containing protein [Bacteroidales bacterium]
MEEANFPFICANIATDRTPIQQPKPYTTIEATGKKIFILSVLGTGNNGLPSTHAKKLEGIDFQDPIESTGRYISMKEDYDTSIALTHLGFYKDKALAETYADIDLIIGGHSHTLEESAEKVNQTLITQAGNDMNYVGKIILTFRNNNIDIETSIKDLENYDKKDKSIAELIEQYNTNEALQEVIGITEAPIRGKEELDSLFTDAQTATHNLDLVFQNNGGIRIPEIPEGEIKVNTIYELDPFGNDWVENLIEFIKQEKRINYSGEKKNFVKEVD